MMFGSREKVFVSYSSENDRFVRDEILPGIKRARRKHWFAPHSIGVGQDWQVKLLEGLEDCDRVLVVVSKEAQNSNYVKGELAAAAKKLLDKQARIDARLVHRAILPVKLEPRGPFGEVLKPEVGEELVQVGFEDLADAAQDEVNPHLIHPYLTLVNHLAFPYSPELEKNCSEKTGKYLGKLDRLKEWQRRSIKEYIEERDRARKNLQKAVKSSAYLRWGFKPITWVFVPLTSAPLQRVVVAAGLFAALFFLLPLNLQRIVDNASDRASIEPAPPVEVPQGLVGATIADASSALTGSGLVLGGTVDDFQPDQPTNVVLASYPSPGSKAPSGTSTILTINRHSEVPQLVGVSRDQAIESLRAQQLVPATKDVAGFDPDQAVDAVLSTYPPSGARVRQGSSVVLIVNKLVRVPAIEPGTAIVAARSELEVAGLASVEELAIGFDQAMPIDCVLRIEPAEGALVRPGSRVRLFVNRLVELPDISNLSLADANARLLGQGINGLQGGWTDASASVVRGTSPPAGGRIPAGTPVLYVMVEADKDLPEPPPIPLNGLVGMTVREAKKVLGMLGLQAGLPEGAQDHMIVAVAPGAAARGSTVSLELQRSASFPDLGSATPPLTEVLARLSEAGIAVDVPELVIDFEDADGKAVRTGQPVDAATKIRPTLGVTRLRRDCHECDRLLRELAQDRSSDPKASPSADWRRRARELVDRIKRVLAPLSGQRQLRGSALSEEVRELGRKRSQLERELIPAPDPVPGPLPAQDGLEFLGADPDSGHPLYLLTASGDKPVWQGGKPVIKPETGLVFVLVPAGEFQMGSNSGSDWEKPVHRVRLDHFLIAKYEMTVAQWFRLTQSRKAGDETMPVASVSWRECTDALQKWGLTLPTEAQWEYACRAGTTTNWHTGNQILQSQAQTGTDRRAPVASYPANKFGLYDTHGNVWEWCLDGYDRQFYGKRAASEPNPMASNQRAEFRVARGGGYRVEDAKVTASTRGGYSTTAHSPYHGIRPARVVQQ